MDEKKNILHVIESSETGGAESIFLEIILGQKEKFNHYVLLFEHGWLEDQLKINNITYYVILSEKSYDFSLIFKMIRLLKSLSINLIHSHLFGANVYSSIAGALCKTPVISTFHGMVDVSETDKSLHIKFFILGKFSSRIIFVSQYMEDMFRSKFKVNFAQAKVIYNGTDTSIKKNMANNRNQFREKIGCAEETCLVVAVGDVRRVKGYNILIEAANELIGKGNYKFAVAGTITDMYDEYKATIKQYGMENIFHFLGYMDNVKPLLYGGDIFVLSSLSEGFSIATIEAMAAHLPIVATASGGPEEIIAHGYNGMLIPIGSESAIVDSIVQLNSDAEMRKRFVENAYSDVTRCFSIDKMHTSYTELYRELIYG